MGQVGEASEGAAAPAADEPGARSWLERGLGLIARVRAGEGVSVALLACALFLLMMAYYIIKPVREALLIQHEDGAYYKSYLGAAIVPVLALLVPLYGKLVDRLPRNRLVVGVTLFFASHLPIFFALSSLDGARGSLWLGCVFFVWIGIFNMMLVAQLWAFGADIYTEEQGKRLFVIVGVGQSVGAIAGSVVKAALSSVFNLFEMLLVSATALLAVAVIVQIVHAREARRVDAPAAGPAPEEKPKSPEPEPSQKGAFAMVMRQRYLRLIAFFSLIFTLVNTNGEFMLGLLIGEAAASLEDMEKLAFIGGKYNTFFGIVNALGFVFQFFLVSRVVRYVGMSRAFFVFPLIALCSASGVALVPVLGVLFVAKIGENSVDYSLNNTLRQMLWLPTAREVKYKAKQAVDTFFVRSGDVSSAACVWLLGKVLGLGVRAVAAVDVVLVVAWLGLARGIMREHRRMAEERERASTGVGAELTSAPARS